MSQGYPTYISCSYDSSTGVFTVPPGGDGLYYFSTYLLIDFGEVAVFNIVVNDVIVCSVYGDESSNSGTDNPQVTCSAVVDVTEGRVLFIFQEMKSVQFEVRVAHRK